MANVHFRNIQTLQYLGNKSRIIDYVCTPMLQFQNVTTIVDLFAGTGSIGYAMKDYKSIVSNDLEYYSFIVNQAILNGCLFSSQEKQNFYYTIKKNFLRLSKLLKAPIELEKKYFRGSDMDGYKAFCDETPSIFNSQTNSIVGMEPLWEFVNDIVPGVGPTSNCLPCLFVTYYANAYFGIRQCIEIDAICSAIRQQRDLRVQYVLLTALMSALSKTASTTTHFAQYLKINSFSGFGNIVSKRSASIITLFKRQLYYLERKGLFNCSAPCERCFNMDYVDLLDRLNMNENFLVYADPPYFKEHYSRYYHILNTLCLYDYPIPDINPQTKKLSVGRYRSNRNVSPFGKKAKALSAFRFLLEKCSIANTPLFISYADDSIVDIESLYKLACHYYEVEMKKIQLNHSKQGRDSVSKVNEMLLICKPY